MHLRLITNPGNSGERWTMPAKRFNEADIDFDAIDGELAKLVPPKLSLTDVSGPFTEATGRATGEGRDGGSDE